MYHRSDGCSIDVGEPRGENIVRASVFALNVLANLRMCFSFLRKKLGFMWLLSLPEEGKCELYECSALFERRLLKAPNALRFARGAFQKYRMFYILGEPRSPRKLRVSRGGAVKFLVTEAKHGAAEAPRK